MLVMRAGPGCPSARPRGAGRCQRLEVTMDRSEASELADLQMHWDEAYVIGLDGDIWWAKFRGPTDELRAHTAPSLRELIRADYARRQQMRVAADRVLTTNPDNADLS